MRLLNLVLLLALYATLSTAKDAKATIRVMTWNIMAPLWVNEARYKELGDVDIRLLQRSMRTKLVIKRILDTNADIVTLQEVQEDEFTTIRDGIQTMYKPVAFAPNVDGYWNSSEWVPEGKQFVNNGVATFYRKGKLFLQSFTHLPTSDNGSIALLSVFRPLRHRYIHGKKGKGNPIVHINSHLESGFTLKDSIARVQMVYVIHGFITKVLEDLKKNNPVVMWAGDFNTFLPYPGMTTVRTLGYIDAKTDTKNTQPTVIYPAPVPLPSNPDGSPIDNVVVKESHKKGGKISFISTQIPDISCADQSKEDYQKAVIDILRSEILKNKAMKPAGIIKYLLQSEDFFNLYKINNSPNDYDSLFNRALRLGSDHLPLTVTMGVEI